MVYKEDLDAQVAGGCGTPGCDCQAKFVTCRPCYDADERPKLEVKYEDGLLTVGCARCGGRVITVVVASRESE